MKAIGVASITCLVVFGSGCFRASQADLANDMTRIEAARKASDGTEMFELAVKVSVLRLQSVDRFSTLNAEPGEADAILKMEQALLTKSVRKHDIRGNALAYVSNMQAVIATVREKIPAQRAWADQMEPLLARLESAAQ